MAILEVNPTLKPERFNHHEEVYSQAARRCQH
jgi:hypothetical protein